MNLPDRHVLLGMLIGATCATALAAIGPGVVIDVLADEMPAGFDTSNLVKFNDRDYEVSYEPWVSTSPTSTATVKKVEGGRVSYVSISTTTTGTYSTDALTSPNVQYPGISVEELPKPHARKFRHWTYYGQSFVSLDLGGTKLHISPNRVCIATASFSYC